MPAHLIGPTSEGKRIATSKADEGRKTMREKQMERTGVKTESQTQRVREAEVEAERGVGHEQGHPASV